MNRTLFFINAFFLLGISLLTNAQQINLLSNAEYDSLYLRYQSSDSTLSKEDFILLYYSSSNYYTTNYVEINKLEQSLKACNRGAQYSQTLILGDSLLKYPYINLTALMECSFAHNAHSEFDKASYYFKRYSLFCKLIKQSGEGTYEMPYMTNTIGDAIEFMAFYKWYALADTKLENGLIKFTLAKNKQKINTLYFLIPKSGYVVEDTNY
jgi:hypothetical protein